MKARGVDPVIAIVILIAIALIVSLIVANWVLGLSREGRRLEKIIIMPDSFLRESDGLIEVYIHIRNEGSIQVKVVRVELVGLGYAENGSIGVGDDPSAISGNAPIDPGEEKWVKAVIPGSVRVGDEYHVRIYTDSGRQYATIILAR